MLHTQTPWGNRTMNSSQPTIGSIRQKEGPRHAHKLFTFVVFVSFFQRGGKALFKLFDGFVLSLMGKLHLSHVPLVVPAVPLL